MKNKKNDIYKTEFLFESDAEKVVLKEASKKIKPKLYKKIVGHSFIISLFILSFFLGVVFQKENEIFKIKANVMSEKAKKEVNEKLNSYSNDLTTIEVKSPNKYEILINKANPIDEEYLSNYEIVDVQDNLFKNVKLEKETYENYLNLKKNLLERGYYINIRSGFRTFDESNNIYFEYMKKRGKSYAESYVVKAGTSEHNAGLAFDFVISSNKNSYKTDYNSDEYFYIENIAYLYGFIIRYSKEKETITGYNYEPWHLRYVGKNLAKYLKKNILTLEEYYEGTIN